MTLVVADLGWVDFYSYVNQPASSAKLPAAQAELGRQWDIKIQINPTQFRESRPPVSPCRHLILECVLALLILNILDDVGNGGGDVAEVPVGDGPQVDPAARGQDVHVVAVGEGLALGRRQVGVVEHAHLQWSPIQWKN